MSIIELVAPPQHIHASISAFRDDFAEFIGSLPRGAALVTKLVPLDRELQLLLRALTDPTLDAARTSTLVEQWDDWSERFSLVDDPEHEEELQQLYIALPY